MVGVITRVAHSNSNLKGDVMETLETIAKRASLKAHLSGREVEHEKIIKILEAARLAPSARNTQPWRFVVVQGKEAIEALVGLYLHLSHHCATVNTSCNIRGIRFSTLRAFYFIHLTLLMAAGMSTAKCL